MNKLKQTNVLHVHVEWRISKTKEKDDLQNGKWNSTFCDSNN